jgi:hypothetical protein
MNNNNFVSFFCLLFIDQMERGAGVRWVVEERAVFKGGNGTIVCEGGGGEDQMRGHLSNLFARPNRVCGMGLHDKREEIVIIIKKKKTEQFSNEKKGREKIDGRS